MGITRIGEGRSADCAENQLAVNFTHRHRRALAIASIATYLLAFLTHVFVDTPGLGLDFFFAVVLLALATGPGLGAAGGLLATGLWLGSTAASSHVALGQLQTTTTVMESVTMIATGAVVGWVAAGNRNMVDRLSTIAERDFLTGLANTRGYEAAVRRRLAEGEPFALLLGDMDGLKRINDLHGHREGNEALRRLAEALRANVRDGDEISRVGGDEFIVLTSTASSGAAWGLAARLENVLAEGGIRMTFGWAVYPNEGSDEPILYHTADRRLYARKFARSKGRDREAGSPDHTHELVGSRLLVPFDGG